MGADCSTLHLCAASTTEMLGYLVVSESMIRTVVDIHIAGHSPLGLVERRLVDASKFTAAPILERN